MISSHNYFRQGICSFNDINNFIKASYFHQVSEYEYSNQLYNQVLSKDGTVWPWVTENAKYLRVLNYYYLGNFTKAEDLSKNIVEEIHSKNNLDKIIAEEEYGIKESSLGNPMKSALQAGILKIIGTIFPLIPFFIGLPVNVCIPISITITLILLSIAGSILAIAAEVSIKKKIIELTTGGLVLSGLSFILGKLTGFLLTLF